MVDTVKRPEHLSSSPSNTMQFSRITPDSNVRSSSAIFGLICQSPLIVAEIRKPIRRLFHMAKARSQICSL